MEIRCYDGPLAGRTAPVVAGASSIQLQHPVTGRPEWYVLAAAPDGAASRLLWDPRFIDATGEEWLVDYVAAPTPPLALLPDDPPPVPDSWLVTFTAASGERRQCAAARLPDSSLDFRQMFLQHWPS